MGIIVVKVYIFLNSRYLWRRGYTSLKVILIEAYHALYSKEEKKVFVLFTLKEKNEVILT